MSSVEPRGSSAPAACKEHRAQARKASYACANAGALSPSGDCSDARTCHRGSRNRANVFSLAAGSGYFPFRIHSLLATGVRAARRGVQVDGVPVRKDQSVEAHAKLAAPFNPSRALGFEAVRREDRNRPEQPHGCSA